MDIQKDRTERIEKAIAKGYESICRVYKSKYIQAVKAYKGPHKTLEDLENAMGRIDIIVGEVHGVSDSCLNDVDKGLMTLYHGIRSKKEQRAINEKRKEMKSWPLPFVEADVKEALKFIAEATRRRDIAIQGVDYYIEDSSV